MTHASARATLALLSALALMVTGCGELKEQLGGEPQAGVGDARTLEVKRIEDTEVVVATALEVKLLEVHDPAEADTSVSEVGGEHPTRSALPAPPAADARLVAVELRISNVGEGAYDNFFPGNAALDAGGGEASHVAGEPEPPAAREAHEGHVTDCDEIGPLTLAPGDTTTGCLVFEVDDGREAHTFRLAPVGDSAEWDLE